MVQKIYVGKAQTQCADGTGKNPVRYLITT